ncbi:MAG: DoxX family membrane protein [Leptospiraceae bacterium]|nr:DoxX family membrane protein [Leptospiraceae bacterium]
MALTERIKLAGRYLLALFYIAAGINHFISPEFYIGLMPPYFPSPDILNILAGIAEIALGLLVIFDSTLRWACYTIIVMLIVFIPVHIYFIQVGSCIEGSLCTPQWLGWVRLVVIHPLLLLWAWAVSKTSPN